MNESMNESQCLPPNDNRIKRIDGKTAKKLSSAQVITSLSNGVKELIENSMDAKSTVITIRAKELAKEWIEVCDNGFGIDVHDFHSLAKRHCTSKLTDFEMLSTINSFGFRGEALNSLCTLASITIQTRHLSQSIGTELKFDSEANIVSKKALARNVGTTVVVENLFHSIPVRRKEFYKNIKREFDKMVRQVYDYAIGIAGIRITLSNQMTNKLKQTIISSPGLSIENNIIEVFDSKQLSSLIRFKQCFNSNEIPNCDQTMRITGFISKCDSDCGRASKDRQFFYVNRRPCEMKNISKFVNNIYREFNRNKFPFILLNFEIDKTKVDFNLSPDKRQILISNEEQICTIIKESLYNMYNKEEINCDQISNYTTKVVSHKRTSESVDEEVNCLMTSPLKMIRCRSPCDSPFKETTSRDSIVITPPITGIRRQSTDRQNTYESNEMNEYIERPKSFTTALNELNSTHVKKPLYVEQPNSKSVNTSTNSLNDRQQNSLPTKATDIPVIIRDVPMDSSEKRIIYCNNRVENTVTTDSTQTKKKCLTEFQIIVDSDEENENKNKNNNTNESYNTNESDEQIVEIDMNSIGEQLRKSIVVKESTNGHKFSAKISYSQNERAEQELIHELKKTCFEDMKIIGQFNSGFIVTKLEDNHLFVVDQHASNERFNFETLLANTSIETQNLVLPIELQMSAVNEQVVIDNIETFRKLNFGIVVNDKAPAGHRLHLSGLPLCKEWTAGKEDIDEIVGTIVETPISVLNDYQMNGFKKAMASKACRTAVMIGETLEKKKMKTIVSQMSQLKNPWQCAHGRPTIRHLCDLNEITSLSNN